MSEYNQIMILKLVSLSKKKDVEEVDLTIKYKKSFWSSDKHLIPSVSPINDKSFISPIS